ncbi:MAG: excinuclease ABC subunit UvrA [Myxococcota bacterium]|nr:excinuclease ABC subunit UvrA [Myxococcota bacterium]
MKQTEIRIENARAHNLRGIDCEIPLGALVVITGVSGSGKSSLAFDTLYAEGQRRYVASLSTYARQFLERLPRPEVDRISSLPPAIAIEQRNRVTQARSTVGTATEILDSLRLLFARAGRIRCPDCGQWAERGRVEAVAERIFHQFASGRIQVGCRPGRREGETDSTRQARLVADGFTRILRLDGSRVDWSEEGLDEPIDFNRDLLLIDRLALGETRTPAEFGRLKEAIAQAFAQGEGEVTVVGPDAERVCCASGLSCVGCGRTFSAMEPAHLSWESPLGACSCCQGFGRTAGIDWDRVVPDGTLSLEEEAIAPFKTRMGQSLQRALLRSCEDVGLPTDRPWSSLSPSEQDFVLQGDSDGLSDWAGVQALFDWLEGRRFKVQARVLLSRYRRYDPCSDCNGTRLGPDARAVEVAGRSLDQLCVLEAEGLREWLEWAERTNAIGIGMKRLLNELRSRVETVCTVGLGYMSLDRPLRTLSGGEAQRIQLAAALGGGLTASLYVLDEPSVGLHPCDLDRLIDVLRAIRDRGNTVVVVEHAVEILMAADHVIDLGPGAGRQGGTVVAQGTLEKIKACSESATGKLLRGEFSSSPSHGRRKIAKLIGIRGARAHNLNGLDVDLPLECLVVVTGVSGAGKSTLIRSVLAEGLDPAAAARPGEGTCDRIEGGDQILDVVVVDQSPAVRSPRSNLATVSKAFDSIRKLFAGTREARALGAKPGWFSFNVAGGRCESCEGSGEVVIDLQFLDDVRVPCEACEGTRFQSGVLEVRWAGRSIADVLNLTIEEALEVFESERKVVKALEPFQRLGLGYVSLGQPLSTLSGGENQRVRLALALAEPGPGTLYILDEPTTGLHAADVEVLLSGLDALIAIGASVVVIEHHLDVIRRADWVIDLGPSGGPDGGRLVAAGSPDEVAAVDASRTGQALRRRL